MKRILSLCALMLAFANLSAHMHQDEWVVLTVAGNGMVGSALNDGDLATEAALNSPNDVAVDAQGNLYIADTLHHRVRKVTTDGVISTVAGTGVAGFSGDGGQAQAAQLNAPEAVAVDQHGQLYIADLRNYRVRKVDTQGVISTFSGTGDRAYSGDGGLAIDAQHESPVDLAVDQQGHVYVLEKIVGAVRKIDSQGFIHSLIGYAPFSEYSIGDGLPSIQAQLWEPQGLAVDAYGRVFIADTNNNRIRMIDTDSTIYTVAGNSYRGVFAAQYLQEDRLAINSEISMPKAVVVDTQGRLYINDWARDLVREINLDSRLNSIAGRANKPGFSGDHGLALQAQFSQIAGLAVNAQGHIYVADRGNHRIRKLMRNQPPVAEAHLTQNTTQAPWQISLDGSKSYDPKGLPLQFEWFDAYGHRLTTAEQWQAEVPDKGEHSFTLSVLDAFGSRDTVTHTIVLDERPSKPTSACAEHAVFDGYTGIFHVPAVDIVTPFLSEFSSTVLSVDLFWHPRGFFKVMDVNFKEHSAKSTCHAQFELNSGQLFVPYADIQQPQLNGGVDTQVYELTLQQQLLGMRFHVLEATVLSP